MFTFVLRHLLALKMKLSFIFTIFKGPEVVVHQPPWPGKVKHNLNKFDDLCRLLLENSEKNKIPF